jgi:flagellar biosynthetic protein FlhB
MSGQKTEAPTPRRKEEARRKGEGVGRSHEFAMALTLGTGVLALSSLLPGASAAVADSMRAAILEIGQRGLTPALMIDRIGGGISQAVGLVLPLGLFVAVAGVAGYLIAGGLVFSTHAMRFDLSRLNPVTGIRGIVDRQALLRLAISSAKLAILIFVSWQVVGGRIPDLVGLGGASAGAIAGGAMDALFELGLTITILLSVVAIVYTSSSQSSSASKSRPRISRTFSMMPSVSVL